MNPSKRRRFPIVLTLCFCTAAGAQPSFREAAAELGILHEHRSGALYGPGIAAVDFDLDGDLDIYLIEDQIGNHLYRNDGGVLVEVADELGLRLRPAGITEPQSPEVDDVGGMMPVFVDLDNDGDRDFFLTNWREPCRLFWNQDGEYVEAAPGAFSLVGNSASVAIGDFDRDRLLDIYVTDWGDHDHLIRGVAGQKFSDVTAGSGLWDVPNPAQPGWSAIWFYHDDDLAPELYVLNDFGNPNFCYWNLGGSFLARTNQWFQPEHNQGASMGFALGDFDRDGDEDLFVANTPPSDDFYRRDGNVYTNLMYTTDPNARALKDGNISWHVDWIDVDNDAWLDLFLVNGYIPLCTPGISSFPYGCSPASVWREPNRLWHNEGGSFVEISAVSGIRDLYFGRAGARGDYDLDGDVDLIVTNNNGPTRFYWNETPDVGHAISLRFVGTQSNREAFGARVSVRTGALVQKRLYASSGGYLSQPGDELYFGLADATQVDELRVLWPSGREDVYGPLSADRRYQLVEAASAEAVAAISTPPQLAIEATGGKLQLAIALATPAYERVRVHRATPGSFSGVVAELDATALRELSWTDDSVEIGTEYRYRVEAGREESWVMSDARSAVPVPAVPSEFALLPPFPNPFNPTTSLRVWIPGDERRWMRLTIYDVAGRRVRGLADEALDPGEHTRLWDGRDDEGDALRSGVYFARVAIDGLGSRSVKLTLTR